MTFGLAAQQRDDSPVRRRPSAWAVDCVLLACSIAPLLLTAHLPLWDLPNHLARQYVIRDLPTSPILQQYYYVRWALMPNLALELFVAALRSFVSIDAAFRLFCIVALALNFVGTRLINLAIGGNASRVYRIAPLFFYSGPFQFGFLSFSFGIGVALTAFGLYLKYRNGRTIVIVPAFAFAGALILLCHMAAFGLYGIAVGAYELAVSLEGSWRGPFKTLAARVIASELRAAGHLVPPFLLFMAFAPLATEGGVHWATLQDKAEGVAALFMFSNPGWEIAFLVLTTVGAGVAFLVGAARLHRHAWPMIVFMAIAYLLLPRVALGTGYVDYRIPSGAIFFVLGFLIPGPSATRLARPLAAWFFGLTLARVAFIAALWLAWEPVLAQFDNAMQLLPLGARLMVAEGTASTSQSRRPPLRHIAALVVARRQGFEPNMFASIAGEILYFQPAYRALRQLAPSSTVTAIDPAYDYLLVIRPARAKVSAQLPLSLLEKGDAFELFRVARKTP